MEIFNLTLSQMLMMFTLIAVGFVLRKKCILPDNVGTILSVVTIPLMYLIFIVLL